MSALCDAASDCYRAGDIDAALAGYTEALHWLVQNPAEDDEELHSRVLLNRGQCRVKQDDFSSAIKDFTSVIISSSVTDVFTTKALIRRAGCYEKIGNFKKALADAEEALLLHHIPPSLSSTALIIRDRVQKYGQVDAELSRSEGRPFKMVTKHQALRLAFLEDMPNNIGFNVPFQVRVAISNELGLWDRLILKPRTDSADLEPVSGASGNPTLQCVIVHINLLGNEVESHPSQFKVEMLPCNTTRSFGCSSSNSALVVDESGKVDATITIHRSAALGESSRIGARLRDFPILLQFSLSGPLPGGINVLPLLSLPICLSESPQQPAMFAPACRTQPTSEAYWNESAAFPAVFRDLNETMKYADSIHATCIRPVRVNFNTMTGRKSLSNARVPEENSNGKESEYEVRGSTAVAVAAPAGAHATALRQDAEQQALSGNSLTMYALESPGYLGIGGKVWDSMYVLLSYLAHEPGARSLVEGCRVLELGSGTGLLGKWRSK